MREEDVSQQAFVLRMTRGDRSLVEQALEDNQINIGWAKATGLLGAPSKEEMAEIIRSAYPHFNNRSVASAAGNMWRFIRKMREGDLVVVPDRLNLYVAKVLGPAEYDESKVDDDSAYRRDVHWLNVRSLRCTSAPLGIQKKLSLQQTCFSVSDVLPEIREWISLKPGDEAGSRRDTSYPLNQILYGPPGTGKTWNTVNLAVAIADNKSVREIEDKKREDVKRRFDKLRWRFDESEEEYHGQIAMVTFHQNFTYEDFIEGIRPVLNDESENVRYELTKGIFREIAERAIDNREKNYILIIDEINRGNIAKIFGELITLVEPSKRRGGVDAATVILPYSKEPFDVPPNLYVVGTMNTADRSIALLDTALRRRFEFVEMMPDSSHSGISTNIEGVNEGVNCQNLLTAMNKRIRFLLDREHQIGHTYFMDVKDMDSLATTFRTKIIPLLQEYFYDNWEKIDLVLNGNGFVQKSSLEDGLFRRGSDLIDREREIYELLPGNDPAWKKAENYRIIYK